MDYPKNNRSGTDDDLSNHGIIRASKGLSCSENMTKDLRDMEFQIHSIEIEAYSAVLRAFIGQADSISWGKEGLISGLRKELRVSDVEHREILGKVKFDDSIKSIRESHKNAEAQLTTMSPPPFGPNSMGLVPHKKLKRGHLTVSSSAKYPNYSQSSQATIPPPTTHDRDNQWGSKGSLLSSQVNVGQDLVPDNQNLQPSTMKARGSLIVHSSKKGFVHSGTENLRTGIDVIKICPTDELIYEIERVCGGENPDPALIQRAKLILKDHEKALLEAIGKLADVSDGGMLVTSTLYLLLIIIMFELTCLDFFYPDDSPDQTRNPYSSQEPQRRAHVYQNPVYKV